MKRLVPWVLLECLGGAALLVLLGAAALVGWVLFSMTPLHARLFPFRPEDASSVLAWGDLQGLATVDKVLHAAASERSFTGDHVDSYVFHMKEFSEEKALAGGRWTRGPLQDPIRRKALEFALMIQRSEMAGKQGVFPPPPEGCLYCFPWIALGTKDVYSVLILMYDPQSRTLSVVDAKI